jgi:hypothetical protein
VVAPQQRHFVDVLRMKIDDQPVRCGWRIHGQSIAAPLVPPRLENVSEKIRIPRNAIGADSATI